MATKPVFFGLVLTVAECQLREQDQNCYYVNPNYLGNISGYSYKSTLRGCQRLMEKKAETYRQTLVQKRQSCSMKNASYYYQRERRNRLFLSSAKRQTKRHYYLYKRGAYRQQYRYWEYARNVFEFTGMHKEFTTGKSLILNIFSYGQGKREQNYLFSPIRFQPFCFKNELLPTVRLQT